MGLSELILIAIVLLLFGLHYVEGQGAMRVPPGRSVMWAHLGNAAYASQLKPNYNFAWNLDCGGVLTSKSNFKARCGVCGDGVSSNYPNEAPNGQFAIGKIVWLYHEGEKINITIDVRSFMKGGTNTFKLCKTNSTTIVNHDCFVYSLTFGDTSETVVKSVEPPTTSDGEQFVTYSMKLPPGLICDYCVLQWIWRNSETRCNPVTYICTPGEGNQETVVNCADVRIYPQGTTFPSDFDWPRYDEYASIHAADSESHDNETATPSLTTGRVSDATTPLAISTTTQPVISTPAPSTPTPPSTISMATSTATTRFPPFTIITPPGTTTTIASTTLSGTTSTAEVERTTTPAPTSTTMPSLTTPKLLDPLVPVGIAAVGAGSTVSGNPLLGAFLFLLAIIAAFKMNPTAYQPLPLASVPEMMMPQWYYPMLEKYEDPLVWYGQSYTGAGNRYSAYGNKNSHFVNRQRGYGTHVSRNSYGESSGPVNRIQHTQYRQQGKRRLNNKYNNSPNHPQKLPRNSFGRENHTRKRFPLYTGIPPNHRVFPEFDAEPPTKVQRHFTGNNTVTCVCNARIEVFMVYCLHYKSDRDGCEKESDICFCKSVQP